MKNKKKINMKQIVCAFFMALIIAFVCFPSRFRLPEEKTTIRIEATARKSEKSFGTDVRIQRIKIDNEEVKWKDISWGEGWEYLKEDDLYYVINPQAPTEVILTAENANKLEIEFYKQEGSGLVNVYANDRKIGTADLYSSVWARQILTKHIGMSLFVKDIFAFCLLWCACFLGMQFLMQIGFIQTKREWIVQMSKKQSVFLLLLFAGSMYYRVLRSGIKLMLLWLILFLLFLLVSNCRGVLCKYKKERWIDAFAVVLTSGVILICIEKMNENLTSISHAYLVGNLVVYLMILLVFCVIFRRMKWGLIVGAVSLVLFGTANYYVVSFRGSPIVPGDFFALQTAATVMTNYQYSISWNVYASLVILISWCVMLTDLIDDKKKLSGKVCLISGVVSVGMAVMIFQLEFFKPPMDLWNMNNSTSQYGIAVTMISNIRRMRVAPPDGYSYEMVEALAERYVMEEETEHAQKTNVIVIMNESFSDLSVLSDSLDSDTYMPYYNSLKENTVKGTALASTLGGGTANSEYEFLTGNTMAFMPGTVPYVQFIVGKTYSIAQALQNMGYHTTAFHPYDIKNYKRYKVYPLMGFDTVFGMEAFEATELERDLYITDEDSYKKIIEVFEEDQKQGNPSFIFNVTMQNHSGYTSGYFGDDCIRIAGMEGEYPEAEEYLTLMKKSDEALEELIEYFSSVEEPTVILLFGDHLPKIEDRFYEAMIGKPMGEWSLEENQRRYEVPFFLWANYDIEEQDGVFTSLNYLSGRLFEAAGLPLTTYQHYLMELSESIPAMNVNGYLDNDGVWHGYVDSGNENSFILEYENVQYHNVFAKKKCEKWID